MIRFLVENGPQKQGKCHVAIGLCTWNDIDTTTPSTIVNLVGPKVCGCNFSQLDTYKVEGA